MWGFMQNNGMFRIYDSNEDDIAVDASLENLFYFNKQNFIL